MSYFKRCIKKLKRHCPTPDRSRGHAWSGNPE